MVKIVGMSLDKCFYDLTIDSAWTFVGHNGHVIVVECTGGDLDLVNGITINLMYQVTTVLSVFSHHGR